MDKDEQLFLTSLGHVIRHFDKEHKVFEISPRFFGVLQNIQGEYYCVTVSKEKEIPVVPVVLTPEIPEEERNV